MEGTEKLSNAFIEKELDGVAPVLSPGLHVVHDLGGIRRQKTALIIHPSAYPLPLKGEKV
jgi:hypothetical protein